MNAIIDLWFINPVSHVELPHLRMKKSGRDRIDKDIKMNWSIPGTVK